MEIRKKLKTANQIRKEKGWSGVKNKIKLRWRERREEKNYQKWIAKHEITEQDRREIETRIANFKNKPLISVLLPVYNIEEKWLRRCIESVLAQFYPDWELCIADDASPGPHIKKVLQEYAARDERIKVVFRAENGHISAASNSALELAGGEFCALLDHDDELTADALFRVAKEINDFPETAFVYSDEDMIDAQGRRYAPKFKPDFSRDLFYSLNLITHLSVYRTDILREIEGFRRGAEGSQDYDLALRFIERIDERRIRHIPRILYHWRAIRGSVALDSNEKPYAHERARAALRLHFERTKKRASVEPGIYNFHRVRYRLPENLPKVSLILSEAEDFAAARETAARFLEETAYRNLEIVLICAKDPENQAFPAEAKVIVRGNLSKAAIFNQAARQSAGDMLCFVDAGLRPFEKDWLRELTSFALQPDIGAAGGKILDQNETISGSGLIFGFDDLVGAAHQNLPREADGNLYRARVINNFSAVSASCLAVRREIFEAGGGFDAEHLPNALFDADFCLRLGERNLRVVFTPYAELLQTDNRVLQNEPTVRERDFFKKKWKSLLEKDPFYNSNLSLAGEIFSIKI